MQRIAVSGIRSRNRVMDQNPSQARRSRSGPLRTWLLVAITGCAVVGLSWAGFGARPVIEGTVEMEQLADKIDHAQRLHPDTARQIERLMGIPQYDCAQVACNGALQDRNRAARSRLRQSLADKVDSRGFATAGHAHD
jgi:hypothetical protein